MACACRRRFNVINVHRRWSMRFGPLRGLNAFLEPLILRRRQLNMTDDWPANMTQGKSSLGKSRESSKKRRVISSLFSTSMATKIIHSFIDLCASGPQVFHGGPCGCFPLPSNPDPGVSLKSATNGPWGVIFQSALSADTWANADYRSDQSKFRVFGEGPHYEWMLIGREQGFLYQMVHWRLVCGGGAAYPTDLDVVFWYKLSDQSLCMILTLSNHTVHQRKRDREFPRVHNQLSRKYVTKQNLPVCHKLIRSVSCHAAHDLERVKHVKWMVYLFRLTIPVRMIVFSSF